MKIAIRKSKHQRQDMTIEQLEFASACVASYFKADHDTLYDYTGKSGVIPLGCEVYQTKTQISAIVYFREKQGSE